MIPRRWAIFIITSLLFLLSQFYRTSIAVITPDLIADLKLDPKGLSLMSAAFFYAFALTQIPLGISLDRLGPRLIMTILSLVAVTGGLVFAWAPSVGVLILGRLLLGIGMACNLMGTYKLLTLWFDPLRFATLTTVMMSLGTAGNVLATTPLVFLVQQLGWRLTFTLFALVNLVLLIIFVKVVRDRPETEAAPAGMPEPVTGLRDTLADIFALFRKKEYWIISWGTFCRYGVFAAVQALWAGPFLLSVMGLSQVVTGNLIFLLNLGLICGAPLWGMLSDTVFKTRKWIVIFNILSLGLIMVILAYLSPKTPLTLLAILFFVFGAFNGAGMIMYAHIKELVPLSKAGSAMTGINFFTMVGAATFMQGLGQLMQFLYPEAAMGPDAFRGAFLWCAGPLLSVALLYVFTKDTHG